VPKQNRPLVRDGRIQAKKRTDRSYLRPGPEPATKPSDAGDDTLGEPDEVADVIAEAAETVPAGRLPQAVRAMQQQGVRKRRDLDLQALAMSDTRYAMHELRRIAILATMVVVTLVVLSFVLR
jgi:hypothetical protein